MRKIQVIDSHTGGEPTRTIIGGGPDLGSGTVGERMTRLRERHDWIRTASVLEPRGPSVIVGALLCEPSENDAVAGVIFFDNAGYIGMCGHGTIGVITTLAHLGRIQPGSHRLETPVGSVFEATFQLEAGKIIPTIVGNAFVTAESTLILDPKDPFAMGIGSLEQLPPDV